MELQKRDVLIVDDDQDYATYLAEIVRRGGALPTVARDGLEAVTVARDTRPDLILLDLSLPRIDGSSLVNIFSRELGIPVIIVSGRSSLQEIVANLEQGADDYVVKPVRGEELLARMRAVLRRMDGGAGADNRPEVHNFGDLIIDVGSKQVALRGTAVKLTPRELSLLVHLVRRTGQTCSREDILEHVWHSTRATCAASTVNEHIRRLRLKLEVDPTAPERIVTVPGFGYRFDEVANPRAGGGVDELDLGEAATPG